MHVFGEHLCTCRCNGCNATQSKATQSCRKQSNAVTPHKVIHVLQCNETECPRMHFCSKSCTFLCCDVKLRKNVCCSCFLYSRQSCVLIQKHSNAIKGKCVLKHKMCRFMCLQECLWHPAVQRRTSSPGKIWSPLLMMRQH